MDIHEHVRAEVFNNKFSRDETKQKLFAWLYNPKAQNNKLASYFDRTNLLNKYYFDGIINSPFNRQMLVDENKALNYLVQSTASDMFLRQAIKIANTLSDKKSEVAFCVHDSLVLDMAKEDSQSLFEIIDMFKKTELGDFKVNASIGKNFGEMRELSCT